MQVVNSIETHHHQSEIWKLTGTHPLIQSMLTIFKNDPKDTYLETSVELLFQVLMLQDGFLLDPHKIVDGVQVLLNDATRWYLKEEGGGKEKR